MSGNPGRLNRPGEIGRERGHPYVIVVRPHHGKEQVVRAAGVRPFGGPVEVLALPGARGLRPDEVLIDVRASGVGNWDEFARTGDCRCTGVVRARTAAGPDEQAGRTIRFLEGLGS